MERTRAEAAESFAAVVLYQKRMVPLAQQNLSAAEADYRAGAGDFLNVIVAEQQKLATELANGGPFVYSHASSLVTSPEEPANSALFVSETRR